MIPPKLLVYRRTHSDANLDTLQETWRRKKSCGDLFQNGYRVRQGHHGQEEKERQTGLYHSLWTCLRILSNWGKGVSYMHYREVLFNKLFSSSLIIQILKLELVGI